MGLFSDDSDGGVEVEDRDLDRLVSNALSGSVTKERLTQLDTTGIISRGIKLCESPLIEYLEYDENPHYILFTNQTKTTLQAPEAGEMLEKTGGWPNITIILTNKNVIIIQSKDSDLCVRIPLESVNDCEVQADSREIVIDVEDSKLVQDLFSKFNQSADIDTKVNKLKIDLSVRSNKGYISGFGEYVSEVGAQSPDNGTSSPLALDLNSYILQHIDILPDEKLKYIYIRKVGSTYNLYRMNHRSHRVYISSNDDVKYVKEFVQKENLSITGSEEKDGARGYVEFSIGERVTREQSAKVVEKLLKDVHNIDDGNDISINITGIPRHKLNELLSDKAEN